jgi:hypothetical protein
MSALSYSLRTAAAATALSQSHLSDAIKAGQLKAKRSGKDEHGDPIGKYVILAGDLQRYLDGLADA